MAEKHATEQKVFAALSIWIQRWVRWVVEKGAAHPLVSKVLTDMDDDVAQLVYQFFPLIAGLGIDKVNDGMFKSPERARMLREALTEAVKISLDEIKKRNDPSYTPADEATMAAKAVDKAKAVTVMVDRLGYGHMPDCIELRKNFKKGECFEVPLGDFVAQGKTGAPCCFTRIADEAVKPKPEAPKDAKGKDAKKRSSFADCMAQLEKEEQLELNERLKALTPAQAEAVRANLIEVDSVNELRGLLAFDRTLWFDYMSAIKEKDASTKKLIAELGAALKKGAVSAKDAVCSFAGGVVSGAKNVVRTAKELDDSLAPLAAELATQANRPSKKTGHLIGLKKWLGPF